MSYEYEAADEMVKMVLRGMETGTRIFETSTERLIRTVYFLMTDKKTETRESRDKMRSLIKQRKALKAFALYDDDLDKFSSLAKLYGIDFFILKDQSFGDSVTDIIVEESDANRVNHIYKALKLTCPERVRREGPSLELDSKKNEGNVKEGKTIAEDEKYKGRPLPNSLFGAKKKDAPEERTTLEQKLKENEERLYTARRYNLPTSRDGLEGNKQPGNEI